MMDIKIYQVNKDRDEHNVKFFGFDFLEKFQGTSDVNSSIYDKVYEGSLKAKSLEDIYRIFNMEHPVEYQAHSLSTSDVVQVIHGNGAVKPGFYFCDSVGFKEIQFDAEKAHARDTIRAVLLEPGKEARAVDVLHELKDLQFLVRGDIEMISPFVPHKTVIT